jgi:hypothetical protein
MGRRQFDDQFEASYEGIDQLVAARADKLVIQIPDVCPGSKKQEARPLPVASRTTAG